MASVFPGALDSVAATKAEGTTMASDHAPHHNALADAVNAVQTLIFAQSVEYATAYGVVADSSTDDTAALQDAIDNTPANGTLVLPAGYIAYTTISITKAIRIVGQGYAHTLLKQTANGDGVQVNVGAGSQISNVEISDLHLGASANRTSGAALRVGYVGFFNARNVRISSALGGTPYEGLRIDRVSDSHFSNVRVQGCASHGAVIQPGSSSSVIVEVYFDSECEFRSNGGDGMYLLLDQAYSEGVCSLEGIHISGSFYNNTKAGVRVHATVAGASIRNLHFHDVVLDSNQGSSTTVGSYDAGLVLDASFNATAEIRRVNICLAGGWVSYNESSGMAILQRSKEITLCCGSVIMNKKHGIDVQNVETFTINGTLIANNGQATDNTWYGLSMGGASTFCTVNATLQNTDVSSNDQRGINLGSSIVDVDLSGAVIHNADVGTVANINGGNGASNARIKLPANGGQVVAKTTTYQVDADLNSPDRVVTCDTTGGAFTVTLPRAANYPSRVITVKRTAGANDVTIAATAGTVETTTCNTSPVTHISNGTDWVDIS